MKDSKSDSQALDLELLKQEPNFQRQVNHLYQLTLYGRWIVVISLWLLVAPLSFWGLRQEIALWLDYFTWTSLRYSLIYNPLSAIGLALCIGLTIATLIQQINHAVFGLSRSDQHRFEKKVLKITQQGRTHPLWKWLSHQ